ncbi:MAG: PfkB family carbohydrate kinase [Nocardioidaceae bacterium]
MTGKVVHTGQAIVDLVMRVDALPPPGGDVFASDWAMQPGGGFNVMAAARRDGAPVLYTGGHGTGPFGTRVRAAMADEGIDVLAPVTQGRDTGFCVALVDEAAERTFVSTLGAEADADLSTLRRLDLAPPDVVYLSGYSLHHDTTREVLTRWLPSVDAGVRVVLDASPMIAKIDIGALWVAIRAATLWTLNETEARVLLGRLCSTDPAESDAGEVAARLRSVLESRVLVRTGASGCWVAGEDADPVLVPGLDVDAVDTNGAGDAHTGVVCASLCREEPLLDAVRRASVAAAIATTRRGPATAPVREETDRALRAG